MLRYALFLIFSLFFLLSSCFNSDPKEEMKAKLRYFREIAKEDKIRMKRLKSKQSVYALRGRRSWVAQKDFGEEVINYLDFLMHEGPKVRDELAWFEKNKLPMRIKVSYYLSGGKTLSERKKNETKGIYDLRMYQKRKKNILGRLEKKTPISPNEIRNIKYPLSK